MEKRKGEREKMRLVEKGLHHANSAVTGVLRNFKSPPPLTIYCHFQADSLIRECDRVSSVVQVVHEK